MQRKHHGFTLIELMIVVAIIGVLAAIAIPSYRGYVAKSRLSEVLLALSKCRTAVSEVYLTARGAPGANGWGCDEANTSSRYVDTLATDADGAIVVTVRGFEDPGIDGKTIRLIPTDTNGNPLSVSANLGERVSRWRCQAGGANGLPTRVLPTECR